MLGGGVKYFSGVYVVVGFVCWWCWCVFSWHV